ncbi:hypothetical protein Adu01nite_15630 [Paractinoplanes durhamensis]|uniref:Uncharacterized protein n=1 Tax=Paractinoplanes durhamensis TaxID=113563 RepID=A0ABQ3YRJ8_9ACTN|nr:hypothetical protein Adu01nite_15630 [Actinoplanes durhamensis]
MEMWHETAGLFRSHGLPAAGRLVYLRAGRYRSGEQAATDQARYYFGLGPRPSLDDIRAIADHYPVFRITYRA